METRPIARKDRREPSADALKQAKTAAARARRSAQLRKLFIARNSAADPAPPMSRLLKGGKGSEVRMQLMLSLLWFQTDSTSVKPLPYPAQSWARLFDLDQPDAAGARRVNDATKWLEKEGFIRVKSSPGIANEITVMEETGNGADYQPPGYAANRLRSDPDRVARHLYVQIPEEMWLNGYMSMLSGAGIAFYLMLLDQYSFGTNIGEDPATTAVWFSPKVVSERYNLSDDT
ncbi:MAG: hypothetical protein ABWX68_08325, partial [Arthrobacter sp.]|uniref:hypothetical protein n=1 Tax=Arthrobacter sp. TaxID=1667 RepID=UPI003499B562